MELFTIVLMRAHEAEVQRLVSCILAHLDHLNHKKNGVEVSVQTFADRSEIIGKAKLPGFQLYRLGSETFSKVGAAIAEYIIQQKEPKLIREIISKQYHYQDPQEIEKIESYCRQSVEEGQVAGSGEQSLSLPNRSVGNKEKIAELIGDYLQQYTTLNLDGFLRFRLKSYWSDLREAVEYGIDELVMEQQYQEFIALLKYFVYIQEAKIPVAHLMYKGEHEFVLLNERMDPIDTSQFARFTMETMDMELCLEDMIVSSLITVSPQQIYIHTREPAMTVIKTIMNIFEGRAQLCTHCKHCHPWLSGKNQSFPYS